MINFDVPEDHDAYTHRVGRTGRAGATGLGISLLLPDQAHEMRRMAKSLGLSPQFDNGVGVAPKGSNNGSHPSGRKHNRKSGGGGSQRPSGGGGSQRYGGGKHRRKTAR